ncbi:hypothetical protein [Saccharicrinis aurantiacus]|uniref:hypothetical protein n=1 Tax=Saccharicrinis aurantiacus TaxID=1849719 RepID=UPI00094F7281|nr:hypothetical protein [Saccharicrinis aurantiacus]
MKKLLLIALLGIMAISTYAQTSFDLPGDGKWHRVGKATGGHAHLKYTYAQYTSNNPSLATGEFIFINAKNGAIQNHHTMGYSAWNQPMFAIINTGTYSELWVRANNGVQTGKFTITESSRVFDLTNRSTKSSISHNGGSIYVYDKLPDNGHIFRGTMNIHGDIVMGSEYDEIRFPEKLGYAGGIVGDDHQYKRLALFHGHSIALQTGTNDPNFSNTRLYIDKSGRVGIGTTKPTEKLSVNGTIRAKEIKVEASNWADYVFADDYALKPLCEVEAFITENSHLPDVPSAAVVENEGIELGEMNKILLQKVEELTLYAIQKDKEVKDLNKRLQTIETLLNK